MEVEVPPHGRARSANADGLSPEEKKTENTRLIIHLNFFGQSHSAGATLERETELFI